MATPAVIIRAIETHHVKLGDSFFVHSTKEVSVCVPVSEVEIFGDQGIWVSLGKRGRQLLLNSEIVEVRFI